MNKRILSLLLPLLLVVISYPSLCQEVSKFNLNINNGLPSNHVYTVITDKHGYLWIATTNGVLRYNGYDFKTFTVSDGLPSDDVWQLTEDGKGRIWLGSIADRIGYIYNEKYYSATFTDTSYHTVYPMNTTARGNNIVFFSSYLNNSLNTSICVEKNDTINKYSLGNRLSKVIPNVKNFEQKSMIYPFLDKSGKCVLICNGSIFNFDIDSLGAHIERNQVKIIDTDFTFRMTKSSLKVVKDYLIISNQDIRQNYFEVLNLKTGSSARVYLKDAGIKENLLGFCDYGNNRLCMVTENCVAHYQVSEAITLLRTDSLKHIATDKQFNGEKLSIFYEDPFWGSFLCTSNGGLDIDYTVENKFVKHNDINISNYIYSGTTYDGTSLWWNSIKQTLCTITKDYKPNYIKVEAENNIEKRAFNKHMYHIGNKSLCYDEIDKKIFSFKADFFAINDYVSPVDSPEVWYSISNFGFLRALPNKGVDAEEFLDKDRYKGIVYDGFRKFYWLYNQNKIFIYTSAGNHTYTKQQIAQFGVASIEKICLDNKYGNIFLKGNDNVVMYDYDKNTYTSLFPGFNLKGASIAVHNNLLIVYGRFGVLFSKINNRLSLSKPVYYPNIKNTSFNTIAGVQFHDGKMLLNTDQGAVSVVMPVADSFYQKAAINQTPYKYVYFHNSNTFNITDGDTIRIDPKELRIRFDIINPYGNGKPKFLVGNNNIQTELNANEYNLPIQNQSPDNYYTISLAAYDNVWRSKPIKLYVYIQPYWWQTQSMRLAIWITSFILIIFLFVAAILITRRMVLNASKKRNLRMEMELKAIYAQINPHFIFNSLNSALLLISKNNMDEAYTHVAKFSRLLRSYIKSSRNKFISVDEETVNLKNYIALQQVRFKDKFDYDIIVDPQILENGMKIPSLLLQPIVENAIEHGLLNDEKKGRLTIDFKLPESKLLICTISDDGIGRQESKKISEANISKEVSYGTLLIKDLVKIFNKYENVNVDIGYEDRKPPLTGTEVTIKIRYLTEV